MSNIHRTLVLNPVEPSPFSMKLRTGLEHQVEVEYLRQNGAPYNTDFAAQLYLIERTTGQVRNYFLPATDVINGKARAFIPAGDIVDRNGYNLQIIGTVEGESRLIARGSASVYETEALGVIPADMIDSIDIILTYNEDASLDVVMWKDPTKTAPYDISLTNVTSNIWTKMGGSILAPFTVTKIDDAYDNKARLTMSATLVNSLPPACWWSMSVSTGVGFTTLAQGNVSVAGTPSMVFTSINLPYTYVKQATLTTPASGQCIHCNNALDILRFSMYDNTGIDQTPYLSQMKPGHTITLLTPPPPPPTPGPPDPLPGTLKLPRDTPPPTPGPAGTLWTIVSTDMVEGVNYYQFVVTPATQSPETGSQMFFFAKA
jgi:hypothetical protein